MNITVNSKKTLIAIITLVATILIIAITHINIKSTNISNTATSSIAAKSNPKSDINYDASATLLTYRTVYMDSSEADAINHIKLIVSGRGSNEKNAEIISIEETEALYFVTPNINQNTYNTELKRILGVTDNISGTCTLIAMTMAKYIIDLNENLKIEYENANNEFEQSMAVYKEIYEIATNIYGNKYDGEIGTEWETISQIFQTYYARHGHNIEASDNYFETDIRENIFNKCIMPSVLSIYNYSVDGKSITNGESHSVTLKGAKIYDITYKTFSYKFDTKGTIVNRKFYAYVISNGWYDSDDRNFGKNLQLLIFEDYADFVHESSLNGWTDYE